MNVRVRLGQRSYDIVIEGSSLLHLGSHLQRRGFTGKVGVVSNSVVYGLYGSTVVQSLKRAGFVCETIILPDGEKTKTLTSTAKIIDKLVVHRFERSSLLVALGGGVIGDLAGFAASIYLRGIPCIQVPTTLVSQVDSSVGGKTGVNHPLGKNLIGTFHQPSLVVIDPDTLRTLPKREWVAGLAEVIKYGVIADGTFFRFLENQVSAILDMKSDAIHYLIRRCCEIKASVVAKDEREGGLRRILNYGHTIGHALEAWGGYRTLIHGEAVGMGMLCEAEISRHLGYCSEEVVERQKALVQRVGLPDQLPPLGFLELWSAMLHDKKVAQGSIYCVLPRRVGKVDIIRLDQKVIKEWFAKFWKGQGSMKKRGRAVPSGRRKVKE